MHQVLHASIASQHLWVYVYIYVYMDIYVIYTRTYFICKYINMDALGSA